MMKKFLALILALVMSLSLVACGGDDTAAEETTTDDTAAEETTESALNVGVFYYNFSDAYITTVRNAMDGLLDAAGITYNNYDGAGNQATQLDQINTAITNGANLLVVNIVETSSPDAAQQACDAAKNAGIENKGYAVQLRTKGGQTTIASPDAETLNDVLGCFDNLTATADTDKTTLTYAYDFGIVGIKRNTTGDGWVVTAKVQGEGAAQAGFAAGNVYTLTVNGAPAADASATVGENGTVTFTVPDASVAGETCTLGVKVARPAAQP